MVELLRAVCPPVAFFGTRQRGLSAASSAQRPPARQLRHPIGVDRARPIGRKVRYWREWLQHPTYDEYWARCNTIGL